MAAPSQTQPYGNNSYNAPQTQSGGPPTSQAGFAPDRSSQTTSVPPYQQQSQPPAGTATFDKYCIIHIATTCDEHGVYVTKDSAEVIEIGWVVIDAQNPERELHRQSVLVRPANTPITPLCTSLTL